MSAARIIVLSGSASGIGHATRSRLEATGDRVIGIDLRDAEVVADLASPAGRSEALSRTRELVGGPLDGVVACAGVGPTVEPRTTIVSLNYFGARDLLTGLSDLLAQASAPAAVAVSSNSATIPGMDGPLVTACLDDSEVEARRLAEQTSGQQVYAGSKLALARWVRRQAPKPEWAGAGIRLNAVAPGAVQTPLLQAGLDDPLFGPAIRNFPIPTGSFSDADQIAALIQFLLSPNARFICGSVIFIDGGTDAMIRGDVF